MVFHFEKMEFFVNGTKMRPSNKISGFEVENFEFTNNTLLGSKESFSVIKISNTKLVTDDSNGLLNCNIVTCLYRNNSFNIEIIYSGKDNGKVINVENYNSRLSTGALYFFNQSPPRFIFEDNLGNRKSIF